MPDLPPVIARRPAEALLQSGEADAGPPRFGVAYEPGRVTTARESAGRPSELRKRPAAPGLAGAEERERRAAYLDHLASTPCDPDVAALMRRVALEEYANPSSSHHAGRRAARCVERARRQVADAIDALPEEVVFTGGATESNNLAILGVAAAARERNDPRRKLLTLGIEHPSVLEPMAELGRQGWIVEHVPVGRDGRVCLRALAVCLDDALLVSIQAANNEIGTIQPLRQVAGLAAERGVLVHSDATQILGKAPFSVEGLGLDFASLSGHKAYGPKGVGALWVRGGPRRAPIRPLVFGGGHEGGLRPGTLNVPGIAGFGLAAALAAERLEEHATRIGSLRDRLERDLAERLPGLQINGARNHRLPGATSLTFRDAEGRWLDADAIVANLPQFDLSTASACHAGTPEPSHVLRATGLSRDQAYATLRVGLGRGTTEATVRAAADRIAAAAHDLVSGGVVMGERRRGNAASTLPAPGRRQPPNERRDW